AHLVSHRPPVGSWSPRPRRRGAQGAPRERARPCGAEAVSDVDDSAMLPRRDCLTQYVIYDHPRDHPEYFVVRPWDIEAGEAVPRLAAGLFGELAKARAW